jgi:RNA polymerase Rpb5, N-terminal domain
MEDSEYRPELIRMWRVYRTTRQMLRDRVRF